MKRLLAVLVPVQVIGIIGTELAMDLTSAERTYDLALSLLGSGGDRHQEATLLLELGNVAAAQGSQREADRRYRRAAPAQFHS